MCAKEDTFGFSFFKIFMFLHIGFGFFIYYHRTSAGSESKPPTKIGKRERFRKIFNRDPKAQPSAAQQIQERCVFWPFDLLHEDCPNARIITWGYDSVITRFFDGAVNQGSIFTHAKDFLFALSRARTDCVR